MLQITCHNFYIYIVCYVYCVLCVNEVFVIVNVLSKFNARSFQIICQISDYNTYLIYFGNKLKFLSMELYHYLHLKIKLIYPIILVSILSKNQNLKCTLFVLVLSCIKNKVILDNKGIKDRIYF